jgi:hypothetical protein
MSITVLQKPSDIQPAQSPIVFSVITSGSQAYTASEFQYTANLYVWSGTPSQSGSYIYQARKYPNQSGSGIFDFSRFVNSTLTDLSAENASNIKFYKVDFGFQYESGSTYVTQSGGLTSVSCSIGGTLFKAYDGYATFPEQINTSLYSQSYWPVMSDMISVTQSVIVQDRSLINARSRGLSLWRGPSDSRPLPIRVSGTASYTDGTQSSGSLTFTLLNVTNSNLQVAQVDAFPSDQQFSSLTGYNVFSSTKTLDTYKLDVRESGSNAILQTLNYEVVCPHYYTPIRILYKNRYGQFDWLNFYKRHNKQFNTTQRVYQPQLGTWQSSTLSYNQFQTREQRYIVDTTEVLECNTDWLEEGYNELFKQLLVSDEIYQQIDNQPPPATPTYIPLTIQTNSLLFKTHVNNKLIQYTITFDIGQPYKLIL